ncbi:MAG: ATP-binding protein [Syntrophotaleaceae bacterium]
MSQSIAIASGKGGTGKTTVAANLAYLLARLGRQALYVDCDVEAPNGHIFLQPQIQQRLDATTRVPSIDADRCNHCGQCGAFCRYNALLCLADKVITFPELCHSCGGCSLICPQQAISEAPRKIGSIEMGKAGAIDFASGLLDVGEAMSPPLIRALKHHLGRAERTIVDAPPGTSCPVIETIRDCDYVILVTEPTPFGLNDLQLAVAMVRALKRPFGIVINRSGLDDRPTLDYCQQQKLSVLAQLPDDRRVAEAYSRGELACAVIPEFKQLYSALLASLETALQQTGSTALSGRCS